LVLNKHKKTALYLLLPRPGAIVGGSIYFWGGVIYAVAINQHISITNVATAWFCIEFLINQAKYWFNDYKDIKSDQLHPRKKDRAPASGCLPAKWLPFIFAGRTAVGLVLLFWLWPQALPFALLLPAIQLLYDSVKRTPILNAGVAACGSVVRFAAGFAALAGIWPTIFSCMIVYFQRLAIYMASYSAEGRYLLSRRMIPGKKYTLFYARHPYLEKLSMVCFLGLIIYALGLSIPCSVVVTGIAIALCGAFYYRINGPGDKFYLQGWKFLWCILVSISRKFHEQLGIKYKPFLKSTLWLKND